MLAFYGNSLPDFATAHYADGGYCAVLAQYRAGVGFTFTGHSLGSLMATSTRLYAKIESATLFPLLSRAQGQPDRIHRGFKKGLALNAFSVLPLSAVLFVLSSELIQTLLGEEWTGSVGPFRILILFLVFRGADRLCAPVIMAAARVYRLAAIQGVFAVLVIGGAWLGSTRGLPGVAAGVAVAFLAHSLLLLQSALRITGHSWSMVLVAWTRPAVLALGTGVVTWIGASAMRSLEAPEPVVLLVALAITGLLSATLLALTPRWVLGEETAQLLGRLKVVRTLRSWRGRAAASAKNRRP